MQIHPATTILERQRLQLYTLLLVLTMLRCGVCQAELRDGDSDIIRFVAEAHRNNMERIVTWTGKATVRDQKSDAAGDGYAITSAIEFVHDDVRGKRWKWDLTEYLERKGKQVTPKPDALEESGEMLREDGFFRYARGFLPKAATSYERTLVIWPKAEADSRVQPTSRSFDPLWYLTTNGIPVYERLMNYCNQPTATAGLSVTREGDIVTIENKHGDDTHRFQFDLAKGGNLIERCDSEARGRWMTRLTYEHKDGVWVPAHYVHTIDTGGVHYQREVTISDQTINKPVDPKQLTLEAMGIAYGAHVTDHRIGISYEYRREAEALGVLEANQDTRINPTSAPKTSPSPLSQPARRGDGHGATTGDGPRPSLSDSRSTAEPSLSARLAWPFAIAVGVCLFILSLVVMRKYSLRR